MRLRKYRSWSFILESAKGSALVSTLVATMLMGISGAALFQYMHNFQKTNTVTTQRVNVDPLLRSIIINNMKSLLVEKDVGPDGQKTERNIYGICSFIEKPAGSHGIERLEMSFLNTTSFTEKRWWVFFPPSEWEEADVSHCTKMKPDFSKGDFSRCFKYTRSEQHVVYAIAQIIARKFPSLEDVTADDKKFDPKEIVFQLKTAVYIHSFSEDDIRQNIQDSNSDSNSDDEPPSAGTSYISYQSDVLWADAVGECHVHNKSDELVVVSLSATGPGSSFGDKRVINSLIYGEADQCEKLRILNISESIVQLGRTDNLQLSSATLLNARVACTKKKFSCRQTIKKESLDQDSYDPFQFILDIVNADSNDIPISSFNVTLKKENGEEMDKIKNDKWDEVDVLFQYGSFDSDSDSDSNDSDEEESEPKPPPAANTENIDYDIPPGSGNIEVKVADSNKSASDCHDICKSYDPKVSSTYVYPSIKIQEKKKKDDTEACTFSKDYSSDFSHRVQCVVCHTKACHRYGLGTFGPLEDEERTVKYEDKTTPTQETIYGLSDEPADGQLPECTAEHSYQSNREIPENVHGSGEEEVGTSDCKAMAMNISDMDSFKTFDTNNYSATSCNTKLPVLCFVGGHYLPALDIPRNLDAAYEMVTSSFDEAEKKCFQMGREISRYFDLGALLAKSYAADYPSDFIERTVQTLRDIPLHSGSFPASFDLNTPTDLKFDFINNAGRGMFLSPSSYASSHLKLIEKMKNLIKKTTNLEDKIWTAMEWDADGLVVASPPWALVAKDKPLSVFYDKRVERVVEEKHRLVVLEDTGGYNRSSKHFALTYNIRWKGLVPMENKNTSLPFVCKNNSTGEFFITTSSGELSAGPQRCKSFGGFFVPPESGLDWAKLMLELNPNDDHYPFPDPVLKEEGDVHKNSLTYTKKVKSPKAWVALESVTNVSAEPEGPRAKELRLYNKHWPDDSVFRKSTKQKALDAVLDESKFSGKKKNRYNDNPIGAITANGIPDFSVVNDLVDFEARDLKVDYVANTVEKSLSAHYSQYKKLCLDGSQRNEYIPQSLVSLTSSCPADTKELDISSDDQKALFKPMSYKYLSYWLKNIGTSNSDKIVLTLGNLTKGIDKYNDRLIYIKSCGSECRAAHTSCRSTCPMACPACVQSMDDEDCSDRDRCLACHAKCNSALPKCKSVCNKCEDTNDCSGKDLFPY